MLQLAPLLLLRSLALAGHRAPRAALCPRVRLRALAPHRQTAAVADAAVAINLDQALDVLADVSSKVTFDEELLLQQVSDAAEFRVRQVTRFRRRLDARPLADRRRALRADAVDVAQRDVESLLVRDVDAGDTCH